MSFFELLESSPKIFGIIGAILFFITLITFFFNFSLKFRLTGATIFSFLLSIFSWAFLQSYSDNVKVEGAIYLPTVYDNGSDLIITKADKEFPAESIEPTLKQISSNLKRGSRSGRKVKIRIRTLEQISKGVSKPIVIGEIEKNFITETSENE
tara:strand:+ start:2234 stop:2692 length:459 start_codon:yes stop_codon:yes gene_type:complete